MVLRHTLRLENFDSKRRGPPCKYKGLENYFESGEGRKRKGESTEEMYRLQTLDQEEEPIDWQCQLEACHKRVWVCTSLHPSESKSFQFELIDSNP